MPTLVRKLKNLDSLEPVGADSGEPQADALINFQTSHNKLSVYEVVDGECDAARLAVAIAAGTDRPQEVAFVVFDCQLVMELDITIDMTEGGTPDQDANALHRDLQIGTPKKLGALTEAIISHRLEVRRLIQPVVQSQIVNGIKNGSIDPQKLNKPMRKYLKSLDPNLIKGSTD